MSEEKKLRRSNGTVTETAHLHGDQKKFNEGYERVFGKKESKHKNVEKFEITSEYYYTNRLFPSDRAKIKRVEGEDLIIILMANGMEQKTHKSTFEKYWKLSKMKVE